MMRRLSTSMGAARMAPSWALPSMAGQYRRSTTTPTPPPPAGADKAAEIIAALEKDPKVMEQVIQCMSPESRRRLVIAGSTAEWFGKEKIDDEVASADLDKDQFISPKDFDAWLASAIKRFPETRGSLPDGATIAKGAAAVPMAALLLIAFEAGLPFVGFGFLDNAVMIVAGDMIDQSLGMWLHCSVMASAAMGNICSGFMGMQVHGLIEKVVHKLNLPTPVLSEEQRNSQRVFIAGHAGGTFGIALGLTLGMLPLLFIHDEDEKLEQAIFSKLDASNDGEVSAGELRKGLIEMGLTIDEETAAHLIATYSNGRETLNFHNFKRMCEDLKEGRHAPKIPAPAKTQPQH